MELLAGAIRGVFQPKLEAVEDTFTHQEGESFGKPSCLFQVGRLPP